MSDRNPTAYLETVPLKGYQFAAVLILLLGMALAPLIAVASTVEAEATGAAQGRALIVLGLFFGGGLAVGVALIDSGRFFQRNPGDRVRIGLSVGWVGLALALPDIVPAVAGYPVVTVLVVAVSGMFYPSIPVLVPLAVRRYRRTRRADG